MSREAARRALDIVADYMAKVLERVTHGPQFMDGGLTGDATRVVCARLARCGAILSAPITDREWDQLDAVLACCGHTKVEHEDGVCHHVDFGGACTCGRPDRDG